MANLPEMFRGDRNSFGDVMRDMDDFFSRMFMAPFAMNRQMRGMMIDQPRVDLDESDNAYLLTVEAPGFKDEELKINIQDNNLTIAAEHSEEQAGEGRRARRLERFVKSFALPANVKSDQIEARYDNGLLEIFVPKAEEQKPKSVQLQKGAGSFSQRLQGAQNATGKVTGKAQQSQQGQPSQQQQGRH